MDLFGGIRGLGHGLLNTGRAVGSAVTGDFSAAGDYLANGWGTAEGGFLDGIGDTFGDDWADSADELDSSMTSAKADYVAGMQPVLQPFENATTRTTGTDENGNPITQDRTIASSLDAYDTKMDGIQDFTLDQANAGSAENVSNYMNPKYNQVLRDTAQAAAGSAGAGLQSSAATRAASSAVAGAAGDMWDTAYTQAMGDSANNQNVATNYMTQANQQLQNDISPEMNWAETTADIQSQQLEAELARIEANSNLNLTKAGQSWIDTII